MDRQRKKFRDTNPTDHLNESVAWMAANLYLIRFIESMMPDMLRGHGSANPSSVVRESCLRQLYYVMVRSPLICSYVNFDCTLSAELLPSYSPTSRIIAGLVKARCLRLREDETIRAASSLSGVTDVVQIRGLWVELMQELARLEARALGVESDLEDALGLFDERFPAAPDGDLILEPTRENIRSVIRSYVSARPTLLVGPRGTGKRYVLRCLAKRVCCGPERVVHIHAGDQADVKSLIGSYVCGGAPGEFKWAPGVLYNCLRSGSWLVIHEANLMSPEVSSVICSIAESRALHLSSRNERVVAHPSFRIFALSEESLAAATPVLNVHHWDVVSFSPFGEDHIVQLLGARHPALSRFFPAFMDVYGFLTGSDQYFRCSKRRVSLGDLLNWIDLVDCGGAASAVVATASKAFCEAVFTAAVTCFLACIPAKPGRLEMALRIARYLYVSDEAASYLVTDHKPPIQDAGLVIQFGCSAVPPFSDDARPARDLDAFSPTGLSSRLLEMLAIATRRSKNVLLVGETGTGKTTTVQAFASYCRVKKLSVINLSQQSEREDLVGGFKPVTLKSSILMLNDEFVSLFRGTFDAAKNATYLQSVANALLRENYSVLLRMYSKAFEMFLQKSNSAGTQDPALASSWHSFNGKVASVAGSIHKTRETVQFSFVEGLLVEAIRNGHWILFDEINLASSDVLNLIGSLTGDARGSVLVTERGDQQTVPRHANFRVFGCMNPCTDVNKKDLPASLRSNFVEIYVDELDENPRDLKDLVSSYLRGICVAGSMELLVEDVVRLYYELKAAAGDHSIVDGERRKPLVGLRSLTRALKFAKRLAPHFGNLKRCVLEGIFLSFFTLLCPESKAVAMEIVRRNFLYDLGDAVDAFLRRPLANVPTGCVLVEDFAIASGPEPAAVDDSFVVTPYVRSTIRDIARALMAHSHPVLLQGPTSAGKTSVVEYLARRTGHRFVRINNHEHTDLQEYIGRYVPTADGRLEFREGLLVEALRSGHWIVLDELNLASSDILEALNRLLDDNRELLIPELKEVVKPHPHFRLFATQNPSGSIYGGRKMLSKAFRNRFIEIHVSEIPRDELEAILEARCRLPRSYCKKMLAVYQRASSSRESDSSSIFAGRNGFVTLRDLFKWGQRGSENLQQLAENGFLILGQRMRSERERGLVRRIIEEQFKVTIDEDEIFDRFHRDAARQCSSVVWTRSMKRLFVLVHMCHLSKEPVLVVGEPGCGKTTVVQVLSDLLGKRLCILNCHQHTETGDFLGSLRPSRLRGSDALFAWEDGPLVECMRSGNHFLLDEISLAEDSVLERLNSVLEQSRTITLAEKPLERGIYEPVVAAESFRIFATMNPGGDFGKRELSPALRNRFTEIWVPSCCGDFDDLALFVRSKLDEPGLAPRVVGFLERLRTDDVVKCRASLRDVISWISYINANSGSMPADDCLVYGACLVFADRYPSADTRRRILAHLGLDSGLASALLSPSVEPYSLSGGRFRILRFGYPLGPLFRQDSGSRLSLDAPTVFKNAVRIFSALTLPRAVLLEGSPGIGKTTLVQAIASLLGYNLHRINLSEQTDIVDLFGCDLPSDDGLGGFSWRDGPFLAALKRGDWILLDELNLASQSVLEGLNSCLDHRGTIYVPEINRSFTVSAATRIFASQNPLAQGGSRKGLPRSFLDRFTSLFLDPFTNEDYLAIAAGRCPTVDPAMLQKMVSFVSVLAAQLAGASFGKSGSPWEVNLRDLHRWLDMVAGGVGITEAAAALFFSRFRTEKDVLFARELYFAAFPEESECAIDFRLTPAACSIGSLSMDRGAGGSGDDFSAYGFRHVCQLHSLFACIKHKWLSILVGQRSSGKSCSVRFLSTLLGRKLVTIPLNSSVDTSDLLGGYEQGDSFFAVDALLKEAADRAAASERLALVAQLQSPLLDKSQLLELAIESGLVARPPNDQAPGRGFVWVDGPVVKAMLEGHWVLLDNANLCSSAVLDRLNSLFEPDGCIYLTEKGSGINSDPRRIVPHPDFHVFMTVNPALGGISRAMRNRGVEVFYPARTSARPPSPPQLRPEVDSYSFNFLLDYHLYACNPSPFSLALFLSRFSDATDRALREAKAGVACDPSYFRSMANILRNERLGSESTDLLAKDMNLYQLSFHQRLSHPNAVLAGAPAAIIHSIDSLLSATGDAARLVELLVCRAHLWQCFGSLGALNDYSLVAIDYVASRFGELGRFVLFGGGQDRLLRLWKSTLRRFCFASGDQLAAYQRLLAASHSAAVPRAELLRLFAGFFGAGSIDGMPAASQAGSQSRWSHYNYSLRCSYKVACELWKHALLISGTSRDDMPRWTRAAIDKSSVPVPLIASLSVGGRLPEAVYLALRERLSAGPAVSPESCLQSVVSFAHSLKSLAFYQLDSFLDELRAIREFLVESPDVSPGEFGQFPFREAFFDAFDIAQDESFSIGRLVDRLKRFVTVFDPALRQLLEQNIARERAGFVSSHNDTVSSYYQVRSGSLPPGSCLLRAADELLEETAVYRTNRMHELSRELGMFIAKLQSLSSLEASLPAIGSFADHLLGSFPEYSDLVVPVGALCYAFYFLSQLKGDPPQPPRRPDSLEYLHLRFCLTGDRERLAGALLAAIADESEQRGGGATNAGVADDDDDDDDDVDALCSELFACASAGSFSEHVLDSVILNDSIEASSRNLAKSSYSQGLLGRKYNLLLVDELISQADGHNPSFYSFNLKLSVEGTNLLRRVHQRCILLLATHDELSENPILLQILDQIQLLSRIDASAPPSVVVPLFERFLVHVNDWQQYAHKGVSLAAEIELLSQFLLESRMLQVSSYEAIVDREVARIERKSLLRVLREVVVLCCSPLESMMDRRQYFESLDQFVLSASVGDFAARLLLLQRLCSYAAAKNYLLHSYIQHYLVTVPHVDKIRQSVIGEVKIEFGEFVRIARWKSTDVARLKQSIEKSNRTVAKLIKRLRDGLARPIVSVLATFDPSAIAVAERSASWPVACPRNDSVKSAKSIAIVNAFVHGQSFDGALDDLFCSVAERSDELSKIDGSVSLKSKALDDLLRYLRQKGLRSKSLLVDSFGLCDAICLESAARPRYFHKAVHMLSQLLQSYRAHHSQIDHNKAFKFVGYVLDLFRAARSQSALLEDVGRQIGAASAPECGALYRITNHADLMNFSVDLKMILLKLERLRPHIAVLEGFSFPFGSDLDHLLGLREANATLEGICRAQECVRNLLSYRCGNLPHWIIGELTEYLGAMAHVAVAYGTQETAVDEEGSLVLLQNIATLDWSELRDPDDELSDAFFQKLARNNSLLSRLLSSAPRAALDHPYSQFLLRSIADQSERSCDSLFKLVYLLAKVGSSLFRSGFCSAEAERGAETGGTEKVDGTGMGEGDTRNARDVSEAIDEESQVEGLKDEAPESPANVDKEPGNPFEMEADFEGEYVDRDDEKEDQKDRDVSGEESEFDTDKIDETDGRFSELLDSEFWDAGEKEMANDAENAPIEDYRDDKVVGDEQTSRRAETSGAPDLDFSSEPESHGEASETEHGVSEAEERPGEDMQNGVQDAESSEAAAPEDENVAGDSNANANDDDNEDSKMDAAGDASQSSEQHRRPGPSSGGQEVEGVDASSTGEKYTTGVGASSTDSASAAAPPCRPNTDGTFEPIGYTGPILEAVDSAPCADRIGEHPDSQIFQHAVDDNAVDILSAANEPRTRSVPDSHLGHDAAATGSKSPPLEKLASDHKTGGTKDRTAGDESAFGGKKAAGSCPSNPPSLAHGTPHDGRQFNSRASGAEKCSNQAACVPASDPTGSADPANEWSTIEQSVSDASFELCEQLRLILEPTVASRLRGSYKSGKRLDMKKIIPYIASDYKRDKIWLRRTRPASRRYRILVSIDNSRSMQVENAALMAFKSLALISKALTTLESGQLGILGFGESIVSLHDINEQFVSCECGPRIVGSIKFDQSRTNFHHLLQHSLDLLVGSPDAGSEWQLHIVISDGIIHENLELVRKLVRRCFECRILIVFLVMDCKKDSIVTMNNVSYAKDAAGKLVLKASRYLDTFPFEHYLVVRSMESLPGVMSNALRQWFELIKSDD